jgi:hypothetical protein
VYSTNVAAGSRTAHLAALIEVPSLVSTPCGTPTFFVRSRPGASRSCAASACGLRSPSRLRTPRARSPSFKRLDGPCTNHSRWKMLDPTRSAPLAARTRLRRAGARPRTGAPTSPEDASDAGDVRRSWRHATTSFAAMRRPRRRNDCVGAHSLHVAEVPRHARSRRAFVAHLDTFAWVSNSIRLGIAHSRPSVAGLL